MRPRIPDFELLIDGKDGAFTVRVVRSPAGEAREDVQFSPGHGSLAIRQEEDDRRGTTSGDRDMAASDAGRHVAIATGLAVGTNLFDAFVVGEVRACLDDSLASIEAGKLGLRLKLRIEAPELAGLTWELLVDKRRRSDPPFALSRRTPLIRYLPMRGAPERLAVEGRLRILAMVAQPDDLRHLDTEPERRWMMRAVEPLIGRGRLDLEWVPGQDWRSLQRALRNGPWHGFHFIGHGGYDEERGEGSLALAGEGSGSPSEALPASELAALLANEPNLRLVVLNSCEGAKSGTASLFSSTAATLVASGIPAVVSMQFLISNDVATEFSRAFYESVADGLPVDASVAEARTAVKLEFPERVEWATPVLHMRSPDGDLFDIRPAWHAGGAAWLAFAALAALVFGFLAPTAFWDAPSLMVNFGVAGAWLVSGLTLLGVPPTRRRIRSATAIVGHAAPMQGATAALVPLVALFAWKTGIPSFAASLTECDFARVECLQIGPFEGRSPNSDYNQTWTLKTQESLDQKLSLVPDLRVHQFVGDAEECADLCVSGRFDYEEGAFQLVAIPSSRKESLGNIRLTTSEESYGIILQQWQLLADSLLDRFNITVSPEVREAMRGIPTADSVALGKNERGVALALAADTLSGEEQTRAFARAIAVFDSAIAIDPHYASPHANKGVVFMAGTGQFFLAVREYEEAIRLLDGYAPYHYNLARTLLEMGSDNRDRAVRELETALQLDPHFIQARYSLALEHMLAGDMDRARMELDSALAHDSTYLPARFNRGRVALRTGDMPLARQLLESVELAWRDDPAFRFDGYIHAAFLLARVEQADGDSVAACRWISMAQEQDSFRIGPWADSVAIIAAEQSCS